MRVGDRPDPGRGLDDVGALGLAAEVTQRLDDQVRELAGPRKIDVRDRAFTLPGSPASRRVRTRRASVSSLCISCQAALCICLSRTS